MTYNIFEVKALYDRIRNLREDADLPQRKLAELLEVTQTTYSRYESGALEIPIDALIQLAQFYRKRRKTPFFRCGDIRRKFMFRSSNRQVYTV